MEKRPLSLIEILKNSSCKSMMMRKHPPAAGKQEKIPQVRCTSYDPTQAEGKRNSPTVSECNHLLHSLLGSKSLFG